MKVFIDSVIPMYVAGREHPNREPARRMLARVQSGEIEGCTSAEALQEILYRYSALRRRDLARKVYELFSELCPEIFPLTLADTERAAALLFSVEGITARAALHAATMANNGVERIATFDPAFRGVPGVKPYEL